MLKHSMERFTTPTATILDITPSVVMHSLICGLQPKLVVIEYIYKITTFFMLNIVKIYHSILDIVNYNVM